MPIDIGSLTPQQQLASIYILYYDRAPEPAGFRFWESLLVENIEDNDPDASGMSLEAIATEFSNQQETRDVYEFFDPEAENPSALEFLSEVYANLFGRAPDAGGIEFWANELETGATPTGEILLAIMKGASGTDIDVLNNKIGVALDWHDSAVAAGATEPDSALLEPAQDALNGVDETPGSVEAAEARTDAFWGAQSTFRLTSGEDRGVDFVGTGGADLFDATLTQNSTAGGVSNTLSSGDVLNGVGGTDTLEATLIPEFAGSNFVGALAPYEVQPTTSNIENIEIESRDSPIGFPNVLDAKDMTDIVRIGSHDSDGDLIVENLTTLTSNGSARKTEDITVVMDHTDNFNSDGDAADLKVLFDNDYLLSRDQEQSGAQLTIELMDLDAETLGEAPLLDNPFGEITFTFDGETKVLNYGTDSNTYAELRDDIQDAIDAAAVSDPDFGQLTATIGPDFQVRDTDSDPDPTRPLLTGQTIVITNSGPELLEAITMTATGTQPAGKDFHTGFDNEDPGTEDFPIEVNVELHKAGRGGEGGDLVIGGKAGNSDSGGVSDGIAAGIEVFNINVKGAGNDDPNGKLTKPSNVGTITSTGGALGVVNIATDPEYAKGDTFASLTVRDGFNTGTGEDGDLQLVDARDFLGNLSLGTDDRIVNL